MGWREDINTLLEDAQDQLTELTINWPFDLITHFGVASVRGCLPPCHVSARSAMPRPSRPALAGLPDRVRTCGAPYARAYECRPAIQRFTAYRSAKMATKPITVISAAREPRHPYVTRACR